MTKPQTINDLIARLEAARHGSVALDQSIAQALGLVHVTGPTLGRYNFTSDLEAALTLIPDDLWWCIAKGKTREDEPLYGVRLMRQSFDAADEDAVAEAEHPTSLAICVCIAALKARQS